MRDTIDKTAQQVWLSCYMIIKTELRYGCALDKMRKRREGNALV